MSVGNRDSIMTGASNNMVITRESNVSGVSNNLAAPTGNRETLSQILNQRKASSVSNSTNSSGDSIIIL